MLRIFLILNILLILQNCTSLPQQQTPSAAFDNTIHTQNFPNDLLWYQGNTGRDSLEGISLARTYLESLQGRKVDTTIVAVIDMSVDTNHPLLSNFIWTNKSEARNNKDDDANGYIDDLHGWNFIGNENGTSIIYSNYEYTRILRKYDPLFSTIDSVSINDSLIDTYAIYQRARKKHTERTAYAQNIKRQVDDLMQQFKEAVQVIRVTYPKFTYGVEAVDSLRKQTHSDTVQKKLDFLHTLTSRKLTENYLHDYEEETNAMINIMLNKSFDERTVLNQDSENFEDQYYGNNKVDAHSIKLDHGTKVAGIIAADRSKSNKGIKGITNSVKIMPLCISPYGDEHDKDLVLAIKYAVDKGARIINISSGKEFSLYKDRVDEAIKYAERHDVLIVKSAGNDGYNLENEMCYNYPNDIGTDGKEIVQNFIRVGASAKKADKGLKLSYSNYGKNRVDIFAPGEDIYTLSPNREEQFTTFGATSAATAIVSGVAALLRSYYPNLTASQVKQILMDSVTTYDVDVEIKEKNEKGEKITKMIPFSQLSKSGGIVNAYNALKLAEEITSNTPNARRQ